MSPKRTWIITAFAALYFVWGSTYLFIRFAIDSIPPFLMAGSRYLTAGLLMYVAARVQRELDLAVAVTTGPDEEHLYQEIRKHCGNSAPRHFPVSFSQLIPLCLRAS